MKIYIKAFAIIIFLVGCDNNEVNNSHAEVEKFHSEYNVKRFNDIYDVMLTEEFKDSTSKIDYVKFMEQTYNIIGGYNVSRLIKSNQTKSFIGDATVELIYKSTYENYILDETFLLKKEGGKYRIKKIQYDDVHAIKIKKE